MEKEKLSEIRNYLTNLNIPSEEKSTAMNFCKKMQYISSLGETVCKETHEHVSFGYGNPNSKICLIVNSEQSFTVIKPLIQEILDKFGLEFWDVYVTFVHKTKCPYPKEMNLLMHEIHAVNPGVVYVFDSNDTNLNLLQHEYGLNNLQVPKMFFVDVVKLTQTDTETRKELWQLFKYLINYKQ